MNFSKKIWRKSAGRKRGKRGGASGKGRTPSTIIGLIVIVAVIALAVALVIMEARLNQSVTGFDYNLSVNSAELDDTELATALDTAQAAGANSTAYGAAWW